MAFRNRKHPFCSHFLVSHRTFNVGIIFKCVEILENMYLSHKNCEYVYNKKILQHKITEHNSKRPQARICTKWHKHQIKRIRKAQATKTLLAINKEIC